MTKKQVKCCEYSLDSMYISFVVGMFLVVEKIQSVTNVDPLELIVRLVFCFFCFFLSICSNNTYSIHLQYIPSVTASLISTLGNFVV